MRWRSPQLAATEPDETEQALAGVLQPETWPGYTDRERLAIEFAERFAERHHTLDDAFFDRLREHFTDIEIVDLAVASARHMALPRITHVLALDEEEDHDHG